MAPLAGSATSAVIGYLLGSLPVAVWIGNAFGVDPRTSGDRNPGATNVWVVAGWRAGLAVGALDIGKGTAAALAGLSLAGWPGASAGAIGAMVGHAWPWWSRFRRGGRSVAVLVGAAPVLAPIPAGIALLLFAGLAMLVPFRLATGAALLAFPALFAALVPDPRRLIPLAAAYLLFLSRGAGRRAPPGVVGQAAGRERREG
jgi:glycerol-3-phosphate acyltransferase PlsY